MKVLTYLGCAAVSFVFLRFWQAAWGIWASMNINASPAQCYLMVSLLSLIFAMDIGVVILAYLTWQTSKGENRG